jgi:hypothetical protein
MERSTRRGCRAPTVRRTSGSNEKQKHASAKLTPSRWNAEFDKSLTPRPVSYVLAAHRRHRSNPGQAQVRCNQRTTAYDATCVPMAASRCYPARSYSVSRRAGARCGQSDRRIVEPSRARTRFAHDPHRGGPNRKQHRSEGTPDRRVTPGRSASGDDLAAAIREAAKADHENASAWIATSAKQLPLARGLRQVVEEWERTHGAFTDDEIAEARPGSAGGGMLCGVTRTNGVIDASVDGCKMFAEFAEFASSRAFAASTVSL